MGKHEFNGKYGFTLKPQHFVGWTKQEKTEFCEHCYDGSYFSGYKCGKCALFKRPKGFIFCAECKFDDYEGHCKLDPKSWHASGWGCVRGKPDDRPATDRFYGYIMVGCKNLSPLLSIRGKE